MNKNEEKLSANLYFLEKKTLNEFNEKTVYSKKTFVDELRGDKRVTPFYKPIIRIL